jgi:hypothetical protein
MRGTTRAMELASLRRVATRLMHIAVHHYAVLGLDNYCPSHLFIQAQHYTYLNCCIPIVVWGV